MKLVGGEYEYVASYIANNQNTNGYQFSSQDENSITKNNKTESTSYATVYQYNSISDANTNNYELSLNKVFGDGICETSTKGSEATSWHSTKSNFANSSDPFFSRGGGYYISNAGNFYFNVDNGGDYASSGCSRVICIVK